MPPVSDVWPFSATCPLGHIATQEGFHVITLKRLIERNEVIRLYCPQCARHWEASSGQRETLRWAVAKNR